MKLEELNGKWVLFGGLYDTTYEFQSYDDAPKETANAAYVLLDGHVFEFKENPSDGYRSSCDVEDDVPRPDKATFTLEHSPIKLFAKVGAQKFEDEYGEFDGIRLFKTEDTDQKCVAEFGTSNSDDYYPSYQVYIDVAGLNSDTGYPPVGEKK